METNTCDHTQPKYETTIDVCSLVHLSKYKCLLKNCTSVQTTGHNWTIKPAEFLDLLSDTLENLHFSGWFCLLNSSSRGVLDLSKDIDLRRFNQLKHLSVGQTCFSFILPNNLEYLIFDDNYNRQIVLTPKIKCLVFGNKFSKPVELHNLMCLEELHIGSSFDFPLTLPKNLVKVTLRVLKYPVIFPEKIKHIYIGNVTDTNAFITCIDNLPNSTETLEIGNCGYECNYHLFVNLSHNICSIVLKNGWEDICLTPLTFIENVFIGNVFTRKKIS